MRNSWLFALGVLFLSGCAGLTGAAVPSMTSKAYADGKFPDAATLPVIERTRADLAEHIADDGRIWCDVRGPNPRIEVAKLKTMQTALGVVYKPVNPDASGSAAADLATSLMGFDKIHEIGISCGATAIMLEINGRPFGPFEVLHVEPKQLGEATKFTVAAWSGKSRRLLQFGVINDPSSPQIILYTDLSRYLPEAGIVYHALIGGLSGSLEAIFINPDGRSGWFVRGPLGGGVYGDAYHGLSRLTVKGEPLLVPPV
ncbi:MAG: hypothetical protein WCE40_01215 [Polyangia bacterium]